MRPTYKAVLEVERHGVWHEVCVWGSVAALDDAVVLGDVEVEQITEALTGSPWSGELTTDELERAAEQILDAAAGDDTDACTLEERYERRAEYEL
jgi:hypothetical protein